tara:strand:- start:11185 stop:11391 length:207 start_codon:yes stop_codon:yes gene_type:complete
MTVGHSTTKNDAVHVAGQLSYVFHKDLFFLIIWLGKFVAERRGFSLVPAKTYKKQPVNCVVPERNVTL